MKRILALTTVVVMSLARLLGRAAGQGYKADTTKKSVRDLPIRMRFVRGCFPSAVASGFSNPQMGRPVNPGNTLKRYIRPVVRSLVREFLKHCSKCRLVSSGGMYLLTVSAS